MSAAAARLLAAVLLARPTTPVHLSVPSAPRRRIPITTPAAFRELLGNGVPYTELHVAGNTLRRHPRTHPVAALLHRRREAGTAKDLAAGRARARAQRRQARDRGAGGHAMGAQRG